MRAFALFGVVSTCAVSICAVSMCVSTPLWAREPATPAPLPADPVIAEAAAGIYASAVKRVSLDRLALSGLDALADHDACLGRKRGGEALVLSCRGQTLQAQWPPTSVNAVSTLLSDTVRLLRGTNDIPPDDARRVARALARAVQDPFTAYLPPEWVTMGQRHNAAFVATTGIEVWPRKPTIVREVRQRSDAQNAGVLPGDVLVSIDGSDAARLSFPEVVALLSGQNDTVARLAILRDGGQKALLVGRSVPREQDIERVLLPGGVLYIVVPVFSAGAAVRVGKLLRDAGPRGVIVDLRHNGGGLVPEAIGIADAFLSDGAIGGVRSGPGRPSEDFVAHADTTDVNSPLVVLIDAGTASASELLAMVLKARGRATLVGECTAGKGSVQRQIHMPDGGILKVTAGYYVGPNGEPLDDSGIQPSVVLPRNTRAAFDGYKLSEDPWVAYARDLLINARPKHSLAPGAPLGISRVVGPSVD